MRYVLTGHARKQMLERDVPADIVDKVFYYPEQIVDGDEKFGRIVSKSR